jgi:hypothetical protein
MYEYVTCGINWFNDVMWASFELRQKDNYIFYVEKINIYIELCKVIYFIRVNKTNLNNDYTVN